MLTQDLLHALVQADGFELNAGHYVAHTKHLLHAYDVFEAFGDLGMHDCGNLGVLWSVNVALRKRVCVYICLACEDILHDAAIYRTAFLEEVNPDWKLTERVGFILAAS